MLVWPICSLVRQPVKPLNQHHILGNMLLSSGHLSYCFIIRVTKVCVNHPFIKCTSPSVPFNSFSGVLVRVVQASFFVKVMNKSTRSELRSIFQTSPHLLFCAENNYILTRRSGNDVISHQVKTGMTAAAQQLWV